MFRHNVPFYQAGHALSSGIYGLRTFNGTNQFLHLAVMYTYYKVSEKSNREVIEYYNSDTLPENGNWITQYHFYSKLSHFLGTGSFDRCNNVGNVPTIDANQLKFANLTIVQMKSSLRNDIIVS